MIYCTRNGYSVFVTFSDRKCLIKHFLSAPLSFLLQQTKIFSNNRQFYPITFFSKANSEPSATTFNS